jgi:uncharacterized glyoxalase superfamily protein PhnB
MPQVDPIPTGFNTLTPHITVKKGDAAIDFYKKALGAEVLHIMRTPDGKVGHAALRIGDSVLMLNEECPEWGVIAPDRAVGFTIHVYVEDVDNVFQQAVKAGATETMPVMDQFWGDRYGKVLDPFGFSWSLATHIKDMTPEEMDAAQTEAMKAMAEKMAEKKTA